MSGGASNTQLAILERLREPSKRKPSALRKIEVLLAVRAGAEPGEAARRAGARRDRARRWIEEWNRLQPELRDLEEGAASSPEGYRELVFRLRKFLGLPKLPRGASTRAKHRTQNRERGPPESCEVCGAPGMRCLDYQFIACNAGKGYLAEYFCPRCACYRQVSRDFG